VLPGATGDDARELPNVISVVMQPLVDQTPNGQLADLRMHARAREVSAACIDRSRPAASPGVAGAQGSARGSPMVHTALVLGADYGVTLALPVLDTADQLLDAEPKAAEPGGRLR